MRHTASTLRGSSRSIVRATPRNETKRRSSRIPTVVASVFPLSSRVRDAIRMIRCIGSSYTSRIIPLCQFLVHYTFKRINSIASLSGHCPFYRWRRESISLVMDGRVGVEDVPADEGGTTRPPVPGGGCAHVPGMGSLLPTLFRYTTDAWQVAKVFLLGVPRLSGKSMKITAMSETGSSTSSYSICAQRERSCDVGYIRFRKALLVTKFWYYTTGTCLVTTRVVNQGHSIRSDPFSTFELSRSNWEREQN